MYNCNVLPEPSQTQQLLPSPGDAPTHRYILNWAEGSQLSYAWPWVFSWLVLLDLCLELLSVVEVAFRDPFRFVNRKSRPGDEKFPNTPPASPH